MHTVTRRQISLAQRVPLIAVKATLIAALAFGYFQHSSPTIKQTPLIALVSVGLAFMRIPLWLLAVTSIGPAAPAWHYVPWTTAAVARQPRTLRRNRP